MGRTAKVCGQMRVRSRGLLRCSDYGQVAPRDPLEVVQSYLPGGAGEGDAMRTSALAVGILLFASVATIAVAQQPPDADPLSGKYVCCMSCYIYWAVRVGLGSLVLVVKIPNHWKRWLSLTVGSLVCSGMGTLFLHRRPNRLPRCQHLRRALLVLRNHSPC